VAGFHPPTPGRFWVPANTLFKIALLAIGIAVGANWPQVFAQYTRILVIIGLAIGIYIAFVSFKK
jgi:uncharacterized membrane protein YgaE (UPF0421/DUF939 family)